MRILAIRGTNLASLAGAFSVDFQTQPLASTGLFAICGPTGAGKSTLLDALCLALYDQTPRLHNQADSSIKLPDGDEHSISQQDARNLLRRGAAQGSAEVDFVGNDGMHYRACWRVRRARHRAQGKLQPSEITLQCLDSQQLLGATKTEVKEAIVQRLGLTFQQFTRAVLLAQNEFAAFLKADQNQRAELLETLTGLDVYSNISQRAHQRNKLENEKLQLLRQQLSTEQPLLAAQREQLQQHLTVTQERVLKLEQQQAAVRQHWQWHERWQQLQEGLQQAQQALLEAEAQQQQAVSRHQLLATVEAVQEVRPVLETLDRSSAATAKGAAQVRAAEQQFQQTQQRLQQAEALYNQALQALAAAEQQRHAASGALQRASTLDGLLAALHPQYAQATQQVQAAQQAARTAQQQLVAQQARQQELDTQLQAAQQWLQQHQPLQTLAEDWPRWDEVLQQATRLQQQFRESQRVIADATAALPQQQHAWHSAMQHSSDAQTALEAAHHALQQAAHELTQYDSEAEAEQRTALHTRQQQVLAAQRLWQTVADATQRRHELQQQQQAVQDVLARLAQELETVRDALPTAEASWQQAERSLRLAQAAGAKEVVTLRAHLEAQQPCPVCGATEHPYAQHAAPSRTVVSALQAEVQSCRKALEQLQAAQTKAATRYELEQQRSASVAKELANVQDTLRNSHAAWETHPIAGELAELDHAQCASWFSSQCRTLQQDLERVEAAASAQRQALKVRDAAQAQHAAAQAQQLAAQQAQHTAHTNLQQAQHCLATAQQHTATVQQELQQRLAALDTVLGAHAWRELWEQDAKVFHAARAAKVREWQAQQQLVEQCRQQLHGLQLELQHLTAGVEQRQQQQHALDATLQDVEHQLRDTQQQRQLLYQGRSVAQVERELAQVVEQAQHQLQQQQQVVQEAQQAHTSAVATLQQAHIGLCDMEQQQSAAQAALQAWMDDRASHCATQWSVAQLRTLLAHDRAWLEAERQALQQVMETLQRAHSICAERQAQCHTHEQQRSSSDPAPTLQATQQVLSEELQVLSAELEVAQQQLSEVRYRLRQDDERRVRSADLQTQLEAQEAVSALWEQLNELIGAADGKKFCRYAQQFTLEVLLGYANRHLADIAPRYRLERIADSLALLVVDQDMGDERRSVHSLSGGESFLVSLALALGLASLSSQRVRVESLFIDEGFGSLDAETLRVALDALDNLQALGRKVGVISHVAEMTERISVRIHVQPQSAGRSCISVQGV